MGRRQNDERSVARTISFLRRINCPDPRRGEGTDLFPQVDGKSSPTPDIVVGRFDGPTSATSFFVDVVEPSGDYALEGKAGAPSAAEFFNRAIDSRGSFDLSQVPKDLANPICGVLRKKSKRYSEGRGGSPRFGLCSYFDLNNNSGRAALTALSYLKALHDEFGGVSDELAGRIITERRNAVFTSVVSWPIPAMFVLQLIDEGDTMRGVLLINEPKELISDLKDPVVVWLATLSGLQSDSNKNR